MFRRRDAKILGHGLADDPNNPIVPVNDERQGIAVGSGNFSVDQEVLQLPAPPAHTDRLEPIARPPAPHRQRIAQRVGRHHHRIAPRHQGLKGPALRAGG